MIRLLRIHLNDDQAIGWEFDDELVEFLDRSVAFLSHILVTMKHNSVIKPIAIVGPTELPPDFVGFVGRLPVQVYGGMAVPYGKVDKELFKEKWKDPNLPTRTQGSTWKTVESQAPAPDWDTYILDQSYNAFYWARLPYLSEFTDQDVLPYRKDFAGQIIDVARMMALNKNEYDIAQDVNLHSQIQAALGSANKADEQ
jgi:hypothetical protein